MYRITQRHWLAGGALGLALLSLSACGSPQTATPADSAPPIPSAAVIQPTVIAAPSVAPTPVAEEQTDALALCTDLRAPLAALIKVDVARATASFRDILADTEQTGCQLTAQGTGAQFEHFATVTEQIGALLKEQGWSGPQAIADGPTGTVVGFNKQSQVAQLHVEWNPAPEASCPADQIITECTLTPEQQLYNIKLEVAETKQASGG